MSLISAANAFVARNSRSGPYEIEQSLRFDGSSYLSLGTGTTHTTTNYTISLWFKMNKPNSGAGGVTIFDTQGNNNTETAIKTAYDWNAIGIDKLGSYWHQTNSGNNYGGGNTLAVYRDPSAWYHVVVAIDTTQSAAADRCKYFVNGVLQELDSGSLGIPIPQNYSPVFRNFAHRIGETAEWYLAEYHFTSDGTKAATDFGEYDNNGVWRPIEYTGNYGTFGFYLKFDPSATNGIGHDHSGNGLHWTANSFTTSGTGTDVMSDTPTTNWATLNPIYRSSYADTNLVYSEGNLKVTSNANNKGAVANFAVKSGKWYYEAAKTNDEMIGWHPADTALTNFPGYAAGVSFHGGGDVFHDGTNTSYGTGNYGSYLIGCAVDFDNEKFYWSIDGTWQNSADPAANTGGFSFPTDCQDVPLVPAFRVRSATASESITFNAGQRAFAYTPPTGFSALNTSNLPAPDIKDGSKYFDTVLWTGDGTTSKTVGNLSFQPEWIWIKDRSGGYRHNVWDIVRGFGNYLQPSYTDAEVSMGTSQGTSFFLGPTSSGFTVGQPTSGPFSGNLSTNENNTTFVGWSWLAGGSGTSNTDGSITSTVSANPTAGFSIVSWTGDGNTRTVGHGLGVAPSFIVIKDRDQAINWGVYHKDITASKILQLNTTSGQITYSGLFNNTEPTSTVFTIGSAENDNTNEQIAYCFAEVEGYSKFGSYTGNSNADNVFVYTGFKPAFLLIKSSSLSVGWVIYDTARNTYNVTNRYLYANTSGTEGTNSLDIDILSNGFKIRSTESVIGWAGNTYVFAAFAENPFGGSGVSPATAR